VKQVEIKKTRRGLDNFIDKNVIGKHGVHVVYIFRL